MEVFTNTFGFVAAIVLGIVALSLFFKVLDWMRREGNAIFKAPRYLEEMHQVNVQLKGGRLLERVQFVGVTSQHSAKDLVPWQLSNMVVFKTADQRRILLRADEIKLIEEIGSPASGLAINPGGTVS